MTMVGRRIRVGKRQMIAKIGKMKEKKGKDEETRKKIEEQNQVMASGKQKEMIQGKT